MKHPLDNEDMTADKDRETRDIPRQLTVTQTRNHSSPLTPPSTWDLAHPRTPKKMATTSLLYTEIFQWMKTLSIQ